MSVRIVNRNGVPYKLHMYEVRGSYPAVMIDLYTESNKLLGSYARLKPSTSKMEIENQINKLDPASPWFLPNANNYQGKSGAMIEWDALKNGKWGGMTMNMTQDEIEVKCE